MGSGRVRWLIIGSMLGLVAGIAAYTFIYAKGGSYLTNDPAACANCHIMNDHYMAWIKSSHRSVATCNDCHTPPGFFAKYWTKASNGFWHSFAFTTGDFPDPLRIKPHNREVTEQACRQCHQDIVDALEGEAHGTPKREDGSKGDADMFSCVRCHNTVGHWVR